MVYSGGVEGERHASIGARVIMGERYNRYGTDLEFISKGRG